MSALHCGLVGATQRSASLTLSGRSRHPSDFSSPESKSPSIRSERGPKTVFGACSRTPTRDVLEFWVSHESQASKPEWELYAAPKCEEVPVCFRRFETKH